MRVTSRLTVLVGVLAAAAAAACPPLALSQSTKRAKFGNTLTLTGFNGERVKVRPYDLLDLPDPSFEDPDPRFRYVGVLLTIRNVSRRTVRDSPTNGARIITGSGRALRSDLFIDSDDCDNFDGSVTIPRGQLRRGCISFKVPYAANVRFFELTWASGFADVTGQWRIPDASDGLAQPTTGKPITLGARP